MRVNVYAEELTDRIEIVTKETADGQFTGLRFYLELPVTTIPGTETSPARHVSGPFLHHLGDDDSSAVTFWGKRGLRDVLRKALAALDAHYDAREWYAINIVKSLTADETEQAALIGTKCATAQVPKGRVRILKNAYAKKDLIVARDEVSEALFVDEFNRIRREHAFHNRPVYLIED